MTPAWLRTLPIAHRGLHDAAAGVPENSLAAFLGAAKAGYGAELDVQLSGDGIVMVFHDDTLDRLFGYKGRFGETPAAALEGSALLGSAETVPRLSEVLTRLAGATPLLIEVKAPFDRPFETLLETLLPIVTAYEGPFALQSFHPGVVDWLRAHAPALPRGQIATDAAEYRDRTPLQREQLLQDLAAGVGAPDFLAYDIRYLPSDLTRAAREAGRPVLTWTVRTPEQRALARAQAANLIFEQCEP